MNVTSAIVTTFIYVALLACVQGRPLRESEEDVENGKTSADPPDSNDSSPIVQTVHEQPVNTIRANGTANHANIVEQCERYARIVVNGKNRIEEIIATFGDQESLDDEEEERRRISEAVVRVLNGKSGDKLEKYFRCVERLSEQQQTTTSANDRLMP